jgi:thiol-disulfide isomerase/thioredoxin
MATSLLLFLIFVLQLPDANTTNKGFPISVELINPDGKKVNSSSLTSENKYVFVDFWHSGCGPCMQMFDAVKDNFEEWNQKTNCKIIAIACQEKNEQLIKLIESKKWPIEIYFDPDYNLFRQLNRFHDTTDMQFSFPTVFVFNNSWQLLDKLKGAKRKFKDGFVPVQDVQIPQEVLVIDLQYYYGLFEKLQKE